MNTASRVDGYIHRIESTNPYDSIAAIPVPAGFERKKELPDSFGNWLRKIPLKRDKTVYLYNGEKKKNQLAQFAVLDLPVGNKDLQQCADAVMRLRASWLFDQQRYDDISFADNEGKQYRFTSPFTKEHFETYLQTVFARCGTASLSKQLKKTSYDQLQAGDVLIRGGFPGHAVMVMDIAVNKDGEKRFLLAQSYMPAQSIHLLVNPASEDHSPWYETDPDDELIATPEYSFYSFELKRW